MCNLYNMTTNQEAIRRLFNLTLDNVGNLPPHPGIFPDYMAPVVHMGNSERALSMMRWGMPTSQKVLLDAAKVRAGKLEAKGKTVDFKELLRMEPDKGVTNVRNTSSSHWKRWLGPANRCLVPFTQFSEFNKAAGGNVWFENPDKPLMAFAGMDKLDFCAEGQRRRSECQPLCLSHLPAECSRRADPPEGNAGDPDHGGRIRYVDARALG